MPPASATRRASSLDKSQSFCQTESSRALVPQALRSRITDHSPCSPRAEAQVFGGQTRRHGSKGVRWGSRTKRAGPVSDKVRRDNRLRGRGLLRLETIWYGWELASPSRFCPFRDRVARSAGQGGVCRHSISQQSGPNVRPAKLVSPCPIEAVNENNCKPSARFWSSTVRARKNL